MLVEILLGVAFLIAVGALFSWTKRTRSVTRVIDAPVGESQAYFYGGVMSKSLTTSGALVRLEFLDWGLRIRGIPLTRWLVPTWEARYEDLAIAELVASPWSRIAVWFRLQGEPGGIGFLTERSTEIVRLLEKHDVPINRAVAQIRHVEELYRAPN